MNKRHQQGFTLVELLIAIAVIGVLAAVLIPNLLGSRQQAFDAGAVNCTKAIQVAQTAYTGKHFTFAEDLDDLDPKDLEPCLSGAAAGYIQVAASTPSDLASDTGDGQFTADDDSFRTYVWDLRGSTIYEVTQGSVNTQPPASASPPAGGGSEEPGGPSRPPPPSPAI